MQHTSGTIINRRKLLITGDTEQIAKELRAGFVFSFLLKNAEGAII